MLYCTLTTLITASDNILTYYRYESIVRSTFPLLHKQIQDKIKIKGKCIVPLMKNKMIIIKSNQKADIIEDKKL